MDLLKQIKKHWINLTIFKVYTFKQLFKEIFLFPYDYYLRNGKSSFPLNIALFLTFRCNAKCHMCNLSELLNKEKREFTLEEIENFIKKIHKKKPSTILFGGEPLLRKDFLDILDIMKKYKIKCGIFTNGLLLNDDIINKIANKIDYVTFSLQGDEKTHDKTLGIKDAYQKMIENIKKFNNLKGKTKVIIHTTISDSNINNLKEIVEIGKSLNVDLIRFGHPTFFTKQDIKKNKIVCSKLFNNNIKEISYAYEPTQEQTNNFVTKINEVKYKYKNQVYFTPNLNEQEIKDWYSNNFKSKRKCNFAWRSLFIYPNGDVVPCESIQYKMGNILKEDFEKIWNNEKYIKFRQQLKKGLLPACARCCKL